MRKVALSFLCAIGLSACSQGAGTIPVSATAGPGKGFMSAFDAGVIFADSCLIRGANFEQVVEGVRVHNVTRHAQTGTYYHNTKNLSVKATTGACSLVFASKAPVKETLAELAKGTLSITPNVPRDISVTSQVAGDGLRYFRVGIKAPVRQSS